MTSCYLFNLIQYLNGTKFVLTFNIRPIHNAFKWLFCNQVSFNSDILSIKLNNLYQYMADFFLRIRQNNQIHLLLFENDNAFA